MDKMEQIEFFTKTKNILQEIHNAYYRSWKSRDLKNEEKPDKVICDKCNGFGVFYQNGEQKDCYIDYELGDCCHRYCDYEQFGKEIEKYLEDILELLSVDKINNKCEGNLK